MQKKWVSSLYTQQHSFSNFFSLFDILFYFIFFLDSVKAQFPAGRQSNSDDTQMEFF